MAKDEKAYVRALRGFRGPNGEHVAEGTVIAKSDFANGDWQTLCNMTPPRAEETSEKASAKASKSALPDA